MGSFFVVTLKIISSLDLCLFTLYNRRKQAEFDNDYLNQRYP